MICCHGLMHCRTIAENKTHNNDHAPLTRGAVVKVRVVNRLLADLSLHIFKDFLLMFSHTLYLRLKIRKQRSENMFSPPANIISHANKKTQTFVCIFRCFMKYYAKATAPVIAATLPCSYAALRRATSATPQPSSRSAPSR